LQIGGIEIGQRMGFSRGDVLKIRRMYGCSNPGPGAWICGIPVCGRQHM